MSQPETPVLPKRPPFWFRLSLWQGDVLQLVGTAAGCGLIALSGPAETPAVVRLVLFLGGTFLLYICTHSLAHRLVGRLAGIRFTGYGVRGTNHPDELGFIMRQILTRLPMFTAMTEKTSMAQARPAVRALMFAAGETATILGVLLCGLFAWQRDIPGGVLWFIIAFILGMTGVVSTATMPAGDYARAWAALRAKSQRN